MHPRWLFSLFFLYSSVLCKPHPEYHVTYPVYLRRKSDNRNIVVKQLLIPIDLTNTLPYTPNQLINRPQIQPHVVLEYKPTHFFHQAQAAMQSTKAKPQTNLDEMVPPGQIWSVSNNTVAPTTEINIITDGTTLTDQVTLVARLDESTTKKSSISLEYQPVRSFFHPKPGNNIGQIIPPRKPWPSSAEGYKTTVPPTLEDRLKESSTTQKTASNSQSLEYKPTKPFYYPSSGTMVGQIVPPGKPWPANAEDYANFSQTAASAVNRIKDTVATESSQSSTASTTSITLEYKPTRPFYHPNGGNNVAQIIPPGKPWPASAEGYQNFTQTAIPNRIKGTTSKKLQESSVSTTTQTPTTSDKFTQTPLALDRLKETESTVPTTSQMGFSWENISDIGGLSLYTSKPEKTEGTQDSTTLEVSTDGPLYTSSLSKISEGVPTEQMMEKLPPLRVVPSLVPPKI